jgi:uncharacterized repeat protein (TIGR03803 family)
MQPPIGAPGAMPQSAASSPSYKVLHRFSPPVEEGSVRPEAGLINIGGTLYGTTFGKVGGNGTVFSMNTTGKHKTLHRFYSQDGRGPRDALLDVNGTLYGTTYYGGAPQNGVVFSVTATGVENVVYKFAGGSDGSHPSAGLIDVNGTLYGTTSFGGGSGCNGEGCGTVFTISASGAEGVLYRFAEPGCANPGAALLDVNGTLYGTTANGDKHGGGCVFSVSTSGAEKVLYAFKGGADGRNPIAPLIDVNGTLYGTTLNGGTSYDGTVFSVSTAGKEKVLYSFAGGSDGYGPDAALLNVHGTLYGVTGYGGNSPCDLYRKYSGCGTVYSVSTKGAEKVLYAFKGGADGTFPQAGLVDVNGALYGTTTYGGRSGCDHLGCGTVFEITP